MIRCQRYERSQSRMCRNKIFREGGHLCRRHVIEDLQQYEMDNPSLKWYLENRHLLAK